jgi:nitronate monooxygenase
VTIWPDRRILDLLGIELPIIQAPMAGAVTSTMAIAVAESGGLGSLPCALLSRDGVRAELGVIRQRTTKPINVNFFCHAPQATDPAREAAWRQRLQPYYVELGLAPHMSVPAVDLPPFGSGHCELVEELKPEIVSFHFGLPGRELLGRVRETGAKILSSATTVGEAVWLEDNGSDAIIAQGLEAGGHRGIFLSDNISTQVGTMALVPQVVDAVKVPVIAAGGIADARGIAAAFALGASAVQIGTAYLFCPEATVAPVHRQALRMAQDDQTVITNALSGRPARAIVNRAIRELGPITDNAPAFPLAAAALAPLRSKSEPSGSDDFTPLWSGQAARLGRELSAAELTRWMADETLAKLAALQGAAEHLRTRTR